MPVRLLKCSFRFCDFFPAEGASLLPVKPAAWLHQAILKRHPALLRSSDSQVECLRLKTHPSASCDPSGRPVRLASACSYNKVVVALDSLRQFCLIPMTCFHTTGQQRQTVSQCLLPKYQPSCHSAAVMAWRPQRALILSNSNTANVNVLCPSPSRY